MNTLSSKKCILSVLPLIVLLLLGYTVTAYTQEPKQETVQPSDTFVGTVEMFGLGSPGLGGLPNMLTLKEYPGKMFFLTTQDAVKYGLVVQEGDAMKLIKVKGLRVKITSKNSWITSLEKLAD